MQLFHFSEDPDIREFVPRAPRARPEVEPRVWAIDAQRSPIYFLPRDCPRACFWPLPTTTAADMQRWYGAERGHLVIAIENAWLERLRGTTLYRYRFDAEGFEPESADPAASYGGWVSRAAARPLAVEPVGDLLRAIVDGGAELRLVPSLTPICRALVESSLHFSLIRMRNAQEDPFAITR